MSNKYLNNWFNEINSFRLLEAVNNRCNIFSTYSMRSANILYVIFILIFNCLKEQIRIMKSHQNNYYRLEYFPRCCEVSSTAFMVKVLESMSL